MTTADMYVPPTRRSETPDLMPRLNLAQQFVTRFHVVGTTLPAPSRARDELVDDFMRWLESDSLDWDVIAKARRHGW